MSKPPETPPHSDTDGVHQDGTRAGKRLDPHGADAGDLERARKESAGRPEQSGGKSPDDRTT